MTITCTHVFYPETIPAELWVNTLTHLQPRHFQNFCLTCRHFYEIYTTSWQELFKSHFSTHQPGIGETYKQAYQREYSFPLCAFRTEWKNVKTIYLPFGVNCVKYHNCRLYIGGRNELGIFDLSTDKWIAPLTSLNGVMCDQLAVSDVGGITHIFASAANCLLHSQCDNTRILVTKSYQSRSPAKVVALGFTDHILTVLRENGVLSCAKVGEKGQLTWQKAHASFVKYMQSRNETLMAQDCIISNGRLIIVDTSVNIFNSVNGEFIDKIDLDIPENENTFVDGDKLITIIDPYDTEYRLSFKISYVDMITKKLLTRNWLATDFECFHDMEPILIYYIEGKGLLVGLKSIPLEGRTAHIIVIMECGAL